jgi:hypothetical protein
MASRNGLNPKIRGLKGVGFNRALPAPFGWGNGIAPAGTGYIDVPSFVGLSMPTEWSFECWVDATTYYSYVGVLLSFDDFTNGRKFVVDNYNESVQVNNQLYTGANSVPHSSRIQIVVTHNFNSLSNSGFTQVFLNGNLSNQGYITYQYPFNIEKASFLAKNGSIDSQNSRWYCPIDELRFYNKVLRADEVTINYNQGIGNNPSNTEFLIAWFQFEKFELLDFSNLQDRSDIRSGLRDMSGKNHHAQPHGFNTDPASPGYVLKPF